MEQTNNQSKNDLEKLPPDNKDLPMLKVVADVVLEPSSPPSDPTKPEPVVINADEKKRLNNKIFIVVILLVLAAGAVGAYLFGLFDLPFLGPTHEQIINKMLDAAATIRSAQYVLDINFKSEPRQAGSAGFDLSTVAKNADDMSAINADKRDAMRINSIGVIQEMLASYKKQNKNYPMFLNDIKVGSPDVLIDPATKSQYGYRQEKGGVDYTLHVQMETERGINNFRNAVLAIPSVSLQTMENKLAEVHKDTPKLKIGTIPIDKNNNIKTYDPAIVLQNLPAELETSLHIAGFGQAAGESNDTSLEMEGKLSLNGMRFSAGAGLIKKGETVYVKIGEMPSLGMLNLAPLKGLWVKTEKADLNKLGFPDAALAVEQGNQAKMLALLQSYFRVIKEEKALAVVKELPKTKINGETFYRYTVAIDGGKIAAVLEKFNGEIKDVLGVNADSFSPALLAYLRSPEYAKTNSVSRQNTQAEIWISTKTFMPRKFISNSVFVPPDTIEKLKAVQYRALVTVDLFDLNKPMTINAPAESISFIEAEKLVTGK